jgi:hypothetical protein
MLWRQSQGVKSTYVATNEDIHRSQKNRELERRRDHRHRSRSASRSRRKRDSRSCSRERNLHNRHRESSSDMVIDEFGREIPRHLASKFISKTFRRKSRSRSRETDRYENSSLKDNRRWSHDLFQEKNNEVEEQDDRSSSQRGSTTLPPDYRPPSPEWISKAGGVAIMKKKIITNPSST